MSKYILVVYGPSKKHKCQIDECLEPNSISMTKEKLELDLISQSSVSFSHKCICLCQCFCHSFKCFNGQENLSCIGVLSL